MVFELPCSAENRIWLCEYWNGSRREKRQSTRERKISTREVWNRDHACGRSSSCPPSSPSSCPPPPRRRRPDRLLIGSRVLDGGGSQPTSVMALVPPDLRVVYKKLQLPLNLRPKNSKPMPSTASAYCS